MRISPRAIAYVTLLVYWGPSNALYYLWGFILFIFIALAKPEWLRFKNIFSRRIVNLVVIFWFLFFLSALINYPLLGSSLNNLLWSILTFGSSFTILLALLAVPFKSEDLPKIFRFSLYLTFFQVFLGYFQMLKAQNFSNINPFTGGIDAGDFFVGTTFDPGIGNQVTIKMSLMVLLYIPIWFSNRTLKNNIIIAILFLGWILPSAIYTLIIGMIVITFFLVVKKLLEATYTFRLNQSVFYITIVGIAVAGAFVYTQRDNVIYLTESVKAIYSTIVNKGVKEASRKVIYYKQALTELPFEYPVTSLIGVGPGNHSSRSAWLVSGEYLEFQPPYIPVTPSKVAKQYTTSIWSRKMIEQGFLGAGSITNHPFSTWVAIFAEMGLPALITFALIFYVIYRALRYHLKISTDPFHINITKGAIMSLIYILLLFFVDNLFEWPLVMGQLFVFTCVIIRATENASSDASQKLSNLPSRLNL